MTPRRIDFYGERSNARTVEARAFRSALRVIDVCDKASARRLIAGWMREAATDAVRAARIEAVKRIGRAA